MNRLLARMFGTLQRNWTFSTGAAITVLMNWRQTLEK
jgi:hypothetical protein